jgi:hypothetical protein
MYPAALSGEVATRLSQPSHRLSGRHRTSADGLDFEWTTVDPRPVLPCRESDRGRPRSTTGRTGSIWLVPRDGQVIATTGMTRATVACIICGDQQTFQGSQWEVTVAAQVWEKTHGRAAHDGAKAPVRVNTPENPQGPADAATT